MATGPAGGAARAGFAAVGIAVAAAAVLPFARGVLAGQALYFRDLSREYFPLRQLAVDGLLAGEVRDWNPLVHEGVAQTLPALSYPIELLQLLWPDVRGFSLLLLLHVPLAALAFLWLLRGLGLRREAAAAGALVYALGGFLLSSVTVYRYLQAAAWAPLVVLGLRRAERGGSRQAALAALPLALALSTTGAEVAAQAVVIGGVLAFRVAEPRRLLRLLVPVALACGLAAPTLLLLRELAAGSTRGAGFPTRMVLDWSVHPVSLLQVAIAGLHGDPAELADRFWGYDFFPAFPYIASLYLGAAALALAAVAAADRATPQRKRLLLLGTLALALSMGQWVGLAPLVEALPLLRAVRFPVKAFFSVHFVTALLCGYGIESLARSPRGWRRLACLAGGAALALLALPALRFPAWGVAALRGLFPADYPAALREPALDFVLRDARAGGLVALAVGLVAVAVLRGRLAGAAGRAAVVVLIAADLLRANAGLNPMVSAGFFELSPEMSRVVSALRGAHARIFACEAEGGSGYWRALAARDRHEAWTVATLMETLVPFHNVRFGVASAFGTDLTALVPRERAFTLAEAGCRSFAAIAPRLRAAGVSHVLSLDPLEHPDLRPLLSAAPARIAPLVIHVYALRDPLPLREIASTVAAAAGEAQARALVEAEGGPRPGLAVVEGATSPLSGASGRVESIDERPDHLELRVESDRPSVLIVRDAFAAGWSARVDGRETPVLRANARHRAIEIPAGSSLVVLDYAPPSRRLGLGLLAFALLVWLALMAAPRGLTGRPAPACGP